MWMVVTRELSVLMERIRARTAVEESLRKLSNFRRAESLLETGQWCYGLKNESRRENRGQSQLN